MLKNLFDRGYLVEQSGSVIASKKAEDFYDVLPDQARFPDMTAIWQEQQLAIAAGERDARSFVTELMQYIGGEVERVKVEGLGIKAVFTPCPKCGKPLRRLKKKDEESYFWACMDRDVCKTVMNDKAGKPAEKEVRQVSTLHKCMECSSGLIARAGTKKPGAKTVSPPWWSCSAFPTCKKSYPDTNGKPDYSKRKEK